MSSDLQQQLQKAQTDLAFALAQGDGYAEDEAAERIRRLEGALASSNPSEADA